MNRDLGKQASEQAVRRVAGGVFLHIARTILVATFILMASISVFYITADSSGAVRAEFPIPGKQAFRIDSTGIYALSASEPGGAECSLSRLGERIPLHKPQEVWYGAISGAGTLYLVNINAEGSYELECKGEPGGEASIQMAQGFYENALWVFAWITALPVGLMAGFLLLGWLIVSYSMPREDYKIYPTADADEIAAMEREERAED